MKNQARSLRRHHASRLKSRWLIREKAKAALVGSCNLARRVGIHANTGATCSCWMCGNPRKYLGEVSLQERSARLLEQVVRGPDA
jgi:hypothetical protein